MLLLVYIGKDNCVDEIIDTHLIFMLDHNVVVPAEWNVVTGYLNYIRINTAIDL